MSPDLDRESKAAVDALVYRLKNRTDEDDEPFALEYVMAMRSRGWRPTEARTPWDYRNLPHGDGPPASEEPAARLEETRRSLDEIIARQHAARRRLTVEPPAGAA